VQTACQSFIAGAPGLQKRNSRPSTGKRLFSYRPDCPVKIGLITSAISFYNESLKRSLPHPPLVITLNPWMFMKEAFNAEFFSHPRTE
jgi:hypothetical protein